MRGYGGGLSARRQRTGALPRGRWAIARQMAFMHDWAPLRLGRYSRLRRKSETYCSSPTCSAYLQLADGQANRQTVECDSDAAVFGPCVRLRRPPPKRPASSPSSLPQARPSPTRHSPPDLTGKPRSVASRSAPRLATSKWPLISACLPPLRRPDRGVGKGIDGEHNTSD